METFVVAFSGCSTPSNKPVAHIKASVEIGFDVDERGIPQNVAIVSWTGPENEKKHIEDSAIRAVMGWRLNPNLRGRHNLTGRALKIELLPYIRDRYLVRQNGLPARAVQHASLTKVFARLRRWMVREVKRSRGQDGQKV